MLTLFQSCYAVRSVGMGFPEWRRVALPGPGGVLEQDARTMASLDFLQDVHTRLLAERVKKARGK